MGQCVMKDCGLSNDKLTSPQKKNLRVFLTERIKDRYSFDENKEKFLSENELNRSPKTINKNEKYSVRTPKKIVADTYKNFSCKEEKAKQHFTFDFAEMLNSDKNIASISTKDALVPSNEQMNNKLHQKTKDDNKNICITTLQNIPDLSKNDQMSLNQIMECLERNNNHNFSQNFLEEKKDFSQNFIKEHEEEELSQELAYRGFENRLFNSKENIEDNFDCIFTDEMNMSIDAGMNELEDIQLKARKSNMDNKSEREKKLMSNLK